MTDEAPDRPAPASEPIELSRDEIELIVQALRYLQSTLGREEADEVGRIQRILARLGAAPGVGPVKPRFR